MAGPTKEKKSLSDKDLTEDTADYVDGYPAGVAAAKERAAEAAKEAKAKAK